MSGTVRAFINERAVTVPGGTSLRDAVAQRDPALAAALADGTAYATDGVGRRLDPTTTLTAGAIVRIVRSVRVAGPARDAS